MEGSATIARPKGSESIKQARAAAKRYAKAGFESTKLSCDQFLSMTDGFQRKACRGMDDMIDWIRTVPLPKGLPGLTDPYGWQLMMAVCVLGRLADIETEKQTLVCIPRKQGKTSFTAALGLAVMKFCPDEAVKVYSVATKIDQAKLVLKDAQNSLRRMPEIEEDNQRNQNKVPRHDDFAVFRHHVEHFDKTGCEWAALSADDKSLDGLFPTLTIIDEAACVPDTIYNVMDSTWNAALSYQHMLAISTANKEVNWWFGSYCRSALSALKHGRASVGYNCLLWMPDEDSVTGECKLEEKDYGKPSVWKKLNPSYNLTVSEEDMKDMYNRACINTSVMREFKVKRLNIWGVADLDQLMTAAETRRVSKAENDIPVEAALAHDSSSVMMGVDVSIAQDLTAVAVVACDERGFLYGKVKGFICKAGFDRKVTSRQGQVYQQFADMGLVDVVGKDRVDWEAVKKHMNEWVDAYCPDKIVADTMTRGLKLTNLIEYDFSAPFVPFQGKTARITGCNFWFDSVTGDRFLFHDNAWLRWEMQNAALKPFPDGGNEIVRFDPGSPKGIDGIYALIHAAWPFAELDDTGNLSLEKLDAFGKIMNS